MVVDEVIPPCPNCGTPLVKVEGKEYYGCPNWKPQGKGCIGYIWNPNRKSNYPNLLIRNKVASKSEKEKFHIVEVYESGDSRCGCIAGEMQKFCAHQEKTLYKLEAVTSKMRERLMAREAKKKEK